MRITTIELPIYELEIVIIINDWREASKKFKIPFKEEEYNACAWTIYDEPYLKDGEIFMMFREPFLDNNTILHELTHLLSGICKLRDLKIDITNDEWVAYLQGYIGSKVLEFRDKYIEKDLIKDLEKSKP